TASLGLALGIATTSGGASNATSAGHVTGVFQNLGGPAGGGCGDPGHQCLVHGIVYFSRGSQTFELTTYGTFRETLPPGTYRVFGVSSGDGLCPYRAVRVVVMPGKTTSVTIACQIG